MNPLNLSLTDSNVVQINDNLIDITALDQISADASGSEFIYIKANSVVNAEQYGQLTNLGVEVTQTIAKNTYLCRYPNSDLQVIRQLPFVDAANVYAPSLKTTGLLKDLLLSRLEITEPRTTILLHANAPQTADQVAQEINNLLGIDLGQMTITPGKITLNVPRDSLQVIATIDSVRRIEESIPNILHNEYARGILGQNWDYSAVGNPTQWYRYKGKDQIVCVADTGVDVSHRALKHRIGKEINLWEPYKSKTSTDPGGHGTHVAGSVAEGVATECTIMVQGMWGDFDDKPDMYPRADTHKQLTDAFNEGADIHTNSWGAGCKNKKQEEYNSTAEEMDRALFQYPDKVVTISAGNSGGENDWKGEIGAQNACKNAITVGNSSTLRPNNGYPCCKEFTTSDPRSMQKSSSTGPSRPAGGYVGRIKPDVVAPGAAILSAKSAQMSEAGFADNKKWYPATPRPEYIYMSGTSMSTPHVAGCCAVIREALMSASGGGYTTFKPPGALIKALLVNGAVDLQGHYGGDGTIMGPAPNNLQGFGRVDLTNSILNIEGNNSATSGTGFGEARPYGPCNDWIKPLSLDGVWTSKPIPWTTKKFSVTLAWYDVDSTITENMLNLIVKNGNDHHHGNKHSRDECVNDDVNNTQKVTWYRQPGDEDSMVIEITCTRFKPGSRPQDFSVAWMSYN